MSSDLLRCGNDWVFLFNLEAGLIFPPEIASTTQRPDIVIYSKSKKIVVLIELTCPLEDVFPLRMNSKRTAIKSCYRTVVVMDGQLFTFQLKLDRGALLRTLWHLVSTSLVSQAIWPRKPEMNVPRSLYVHPTPFIFRGTSGNGLAANSFAFKSVAAVVLDIPLHWVCLTRCPEC